MLPATSEPVRWEIEPFEDEGEPNPQAVSVDQPRRLCFIGERLDSPAAASIRSRSASARCWLPAPSTRSVLSTGAVPDMAAALRMTKARVVWIANLEHDADQRPQMSAIGPLLASG